jgi:hypothetical protein
VARELAFLPPAKESSEKGEARWSKFVKEFLAAQEIWTGKISFGLTMFMNDPRLVESDCRTDFLAKRPRDGRIL